MAEEKSKKAKSSVMGAYSTYLLAVILFAGTLYIECDLFVPLWFFSLTCISATFCVTYKYKESIEADPKTFAVAYVSVLALTMISLKNILDTYYCPVLLLTLFITGATFVYTYGLRKRIENDPWKYLIAFFPLFMFVLTALMVLL